MYEYAKKPRIHSTISEKQTVPNSVQSSLNSINNVDIHSGTKLNLEDSLKSRIEQSIGYKLDNVEMRESHDASDMDAKAFAKGNVVHFAPGQFRPETEEGRNLITHELSHVAQQARGGVHADISGFNVNTSEALESQADSTHLDFSSPVDTSSLPSLPTMDSQAAPVQGAFGGIKKFFSNMKKSFNFGRKTKAVDDAANSINSEHQAETDEMMKAMQSSGFSPEEIEAQLLFQRLNKNEERGNRLQKAQGDLTEYGMASDIEDPRQMDNIFARLGRGKLKDESVKAAGDAQNHALYNVLTGREEQDRANELTAQIGQKYANKNRAQDVFDGMKDDASSKYDIFRQGLARYNKRHNSNVTKDNGDTHIIRYLARHLSGMDEQSVDATMDDMLSGDKKRIAPYVKKEVDRFMTEANADSISDAASDDEMLNNVLSQTILSQDNMTISDMVGQDGYDAETLGVSPEYLEQYMNKKKQHSTNVGMARMRLRNMGAAPK